MGGFRTIDGRWSILLLSPLHQCLTILHTSYLSMCDNYYRYLATHTNAYIPFHTFVFIITMKTVPNFIFRYPYLAFRIMTLPINEIVPGSSFYPYLYQVSETHLLILQASQNMNQYAQGCESQNIFAKSLNNTPSTPSTSKQSSKPSDYILPLEELFTKEEQALLSDIFDLMTIPNIPLREQQIAMVQFNFYMKLLGIIGSDSLLYILLRQISLNGSKNKNRYQLDIVPLDSYDIPQRVWTDQQHQQLTVSQRSLLARYEEFKEQQVYMIQQREKIEASKKGIFDRFIQSATTKIFTHDKTEQDTTKHLTTPIYTGITFPIWAEFLIAIGTTSTSIQQQSKAMLNILRESEGDDASPVDDDEDDGPKKVLMFQHLTKNNYIDHTSSLNIPQNKLLPFNPDDIEVCSDTARFFEVQDGYKRYIEQQHRILVEKQSDFQRLYHYYIPNRRLQHSPDAITDDMVEISGAGDHITSTNTHLSINTSPSLQSNSPQTSSTSLVSSPGGTSIVKSAGTEDLHATVGLLPTQDPTSTILWKTNPFFNSPPTQPPPLTVLASDSISNAPALYPHYAGHHYYNNSVRDKAELANNNVIIYCTKGFDRSEFLVSGKCCLTLESFMFIPLVSKTIIPYTSIVRVQLVPQGGVAATLRQNPYLLITYATQLKDSSVSYTSTGHQDGDTMLHLLSRQGFCQHEKMYIDSDDVYLLYSVLSDLIALARLKAIVQSSDTDLRTANELSCGVAIVNAMARYHEAEKEIYKNISRVEGEFKEELLTYDQQLKLKSLSQQHQDRIATTGTDGKVDGSSAMGTSTTLTAPISTATTKPTKQLTQREQEKADKDEQIVLKFMEKRSIVRNTTMMMRLPPFKAVVQELMVLYKKLHNNSKIATETQNTNLEEQLHLNNNDPLAAANASATAAANAAANKKDEKLSILAQNVQPNDPNYKVLALLQPLIHYDHERHHQTLLTKFLAKKNKKAKGTTSTSTTINSSSSPSSTTPLDDDIFSASLGNQDNQSFSSTFDRSTSFGSSSTNDRRGSFHSFDSVTSFTIDRLLPFHKELRFYDIDYSLPCPDGVHPPICNTTTTSILSKIPNFKKIKNELFSLLTRDVLNNINLMISMYYLIQQQHLSTPIQLHVLMASLSCMRPIILNPQREVAKALKVSKLKLETTSTLFDLRDVFHKGREQQQKTLLLNHIQYLLIYFPSKLPEHIRDYFSTRPALVGLASHQQFTLSALKSPSPTGLGPGGTIGPMNEKEREKAINIATNGGVHSLNSPSFGSMSSSGQDKDAKSSFSVSGSTQTTSATEDIQAKFEKSMPHSQYGALLQQKLHFIDTHSLHTPEYLSTIESTIDKYPWVLNVISSSLLEERAAEYMVKVYQAKIAFEKTIKTVPAAFKTTTEITPPTVTTVAVTGTSAPTTTVTVSSSTTLNNTARPVRSGSSSSIEPLLPDSPDVDSNTNNIDAPSVSTASATSTSALTITPPQQQSSSTTTLSTSSPSSSSQVVISPSQTTTQPNRNSDNLHYAMNITMQTEQLCDLSLFEYPNFVNKFIDLQYYGHHVFSRDLLLQQQHYNALLQRISTARQERLEVENKERESRRRLRDRIRGRNNITSSTMIQDAPEDESDHHHHDSSDDDHDKRDGKDEISELGSRKNRFMLDLDNSLVSSPSLITPSHNNTNLATPSASTNQPSGFGTNRFGADTTRFQGNNNTPGKSTGIQGTTLTISSNQMAQRAQPLNPHGDNNNTDQKNTNDPHIGQLQVAESSKGNLFQRNGTLTRSDTSVRPRSSSIGPGGHGSSNGGSVTNLSSLPQINFPGSGVLTAQEANVLHRFWYYQGLAHTQRHFKHVSAQEQFVLNPDNPNNTPNRMVVNGLSLFLSTFVSQPTYLHCVPFHQQLQFTQHVFYQHQQLQPFAYHLAREQQPLVNEEMVITARTVGDGVASIMEILQEHNLNKFSIKSGIETVLLTKTVVDPIFIFVKMISTILKWKHPEITFTIVTILLTLAASNMLYLIAPIVVFLLVLFLLLHKNNTFWLELELGPWCEGDLPMSKRYNELKEEMVPSPKYHGIMVPKSSLLSSEEKYALISTQQLKKRQRSRYVYYAVRGKDYWGNPLLRYNVDSTEDDDDTTNNNKQQQQKMLLENGNAINSNSNALLSPTSIETPPFNASSPIDYNGIDTIAPLHPVDNDKKASVGMNNLNDSTMNVFATHRDLSSMITTSDHFDTPQRPSSPRQQQQQQQQQQPQQPQQPQVQYQQYQPSIPTTNNTSNSNACLTSSTLLNQQLLYYTPTQFRATFKPVYGTIATASLTTTKSTFLNVVSKISSIQTQINSAYEKATAIQNTLTGVNHKFMKIQGLFRWTTAQTTQKLVMVLTGAIFALLIIPFRIIFAAIIIDVFSKKWQTKKGFMDRLISEVEIANGAHYTLVTDDDINKIFPKPSKKKNKNKNGANGLDDANGTLGEANGNNNNGDDKFE